MDEPRDDGRAEVLRTVGRYALAAFLVFAGVAHLLRPDEFLAQVPPWAPAPAAIVLVSGLIEIVLGGALLALRRHRVQVGWVIAAFFVIVFPGNVSQAVSGADAFGLDTPTARWVRLAFQPILVVWALWSTGAWRWWRTRDRAEAR